MTDINLGSMSTVEAKEAFAAFKEMMDEFTHTVENPDSYTKDEIVRDFKILITIFNDMFDATAMAMEMAVLTNSAVTDFTPTEE